MALLFLTSMPVMTLLEITAVVFSLDVPHLRSTMPSWLLATALKMARTTGLSRTLGDQTGESTV